MILKLTLKIQSNAEYPWNKEIISNTENCSVNFSVALVSLNKKGNISVWFPL